MNRRDAAMLLALRYPGGLEALGPRMGKRPDTLRKELTGQPGYKWGGDDEEMLIALCLAARVEDPLAPITAAAANAGALLIPLPQHTDCQADSSGPACLPAEAEFPPAGGRAIACTLRRRAAHSWPRATRMSVEVLTQVFNRYPVGGGEYALALAIADFAWADGTNIYPGVERLAEKSRQSVRSVQVQLRRMVAIGWLIEVKDGQGGRGKSTQYRISPSWLKGAELAPFSKPEKGAERGTKRVQNDAQKGAVDGSPYITVLTVIEPPPLPPKGGATDFETALAEYPRKSHVSKAAKQWQELNPDAQLVATIVSSIRAWARSPEWQREDGRYVPKFSNWLRDKRWQDVPGYSVPPPTPAPTPAPEPALTEEQLRANARRAREAAALARRTLLGERAAVAA